MAEKEIPDLKQAESGLPPPQPVDVPKRKPVPTKEAFIVESSSVDQGSDQGNDQAQQLSTDPEKDPVVAVSESQATGNGTTRRLALPALPALPAVSLAVFDRVKFGPLEKYLPLEQRKRRYTVAGILIGLIVALLALIIGLAAGLTANKKTQNLPLPTSNGGPYSGDLTYYGPALGACGITSSSSDSICAVSHIIFDAVQTGSNPNANPLCGLKIRLRRNDASVDVTVVDRCVGCKATDIDTTTSVFSQLAEIDQGRVTVEWAWLESSPVNVTAV